MSLCIRVVPIHGEILAGALDDVIVWVTDTASFSMSSRGSGTTEDLSNSMW
jgi:hypothetical protein